MIFGARFGFLVKHLVWSIVNCITPLEYSIGRNPVVMVMKALPAVCAKSNSNLENNSSKFGLFGIRRTTWWLYIDRKDMCVPQGFNESQLEFTC